MNAAIKLLMQELSASFEHAQALPDMAISLLQSYIKDNQIPDQNVLKNIRSLAETDGFPQHKMRIILDLLDQL